MRALFWALAWPLDIIQSLLPGDPESLSPDTPSPAAVLAALLVDFIVYSLVVYGLAVLFGRLKSGQRPALSERRI